MSIYFFKTPDTSLTGDYKIEVELLRKEIIPVFFGYNAEDMEDLERIGFEDLQNQYAYEVRVSVNGKTHIISTDEESFLLPSITVELYPYLLVQVDIRQDLIPLVSLREKRDITRYDRVVDWYWTDTEFPLIGKEEWEAGKEDRKKIFANELSKLLDRVNNKRIHKASVSERILRLYKMHFGATPPNLSLRDISSLAGE